VQKHTPLTQLKTGSIRGSPFARCQIKLTASKKEDYFQSFQNMRDQIGANVSWGTKNKIA